MTRALLEHYKLLLTLKHNGAGFPSRISPALIVFIAIYAVLTAVRIMSGDSTADDGSIFRSVFISIAGAIISIVYVPQVFSGMVLLKILELAAISFVGFVLSHHEITMLTHLPPLIYGYSTFCVIMLFIKTPKKTPDGKSAK